MRDGFDPMAICGRWGGAGRGSAAGCVSDGWPQAGPSGQLPLGDNLVK